MQSRLHFSALHHVNQPGKVQGRPICDPSNHPSDPRLNLNGPDTKEACEKEFGKICLTTLEEICVMVVEYEQKVSESLRGMIVMFKADLKGAFSLLTMAACCASLSAYEMSILGESCVLILLAGYFGWTGFPFAFSVMSRVLMFLVNRSIRGDSRVYVDDLIFCTLACYLNSDVDTAFRTIRQLLGPKSIATDKLEGGRELDILGWTVNLNNKFVGLTVRNFLKGIFWFATILVSKKGGDDTGSRENRGLCCSFRDGVPSDVPLSCPAFQAAVVFAAQKQPVHYEDVGRR